MNAPSSTHGVLSTAAFAHPLRNVEALGVNPGMTVADFGSGSGAYVLAIAERLQGDGEVYAIDVQRDLLRKVHNEAHKRGLKGVKVIWGDLEMPGGSKLSDSLCDLVLISNLLFQVEEKERLFVEAERVLKNDGRLAVVDWQESFGGIGPVESHVVNEERAITFAEDAGFAMREQFAAGAHHYGLIFKPAHHVFRR